MRDITSLTELLTITDDIEEMAADGRDNEGGRFDWEAFLSRVESKLDVNLPGDMEHPVIRKIQRVARAAFAEAFD